MSNTGLSVRIHQQAPITLDVQLHCKAGEVLALVGPSGSGKTTVLRTIAGLYKGTEKVHINCGKQCWQDTDKQHFMQVQERRTGLVFQDYALFPHKTVLDNIALAVPEKKRSARRAKAQALLAQVNMDGLQDRYPRQLSGGQKQRVALARALALEPSVLLLDEPFSAVDQQTRRRLYRELAALRASLSIPVILVTHDLTEVQLLADSLCLIHRGSTLQQGPVHTVINQPLTRLAAKLVGHQNVYNAQLAYQHQDRAVYQLSETCRLHGQPMAHVQAGETVSVVIMPSAIHVLNVSSQRSVQAHSDAAQQARQTHAFDALKTPSQQDIATGQTLHGSVQDALVLGDELLVRLRLDDVPKALRFKLPLHEANTLGIVPSCRLTVGVLTHGVLGLDNKHQAALGYTDASAVTK